MGSTAGDTVPLALVDVAAQTAADDGLDRR